MINHNFKYSSVPTRLVVLMHMVDIHWVQLRRAARSVHGLHACHICTAPYARPPTHAPPLTFYPVPGISIQLGHPEHRAAEVAPVL